MLSCGLKVFVLPTTRAISFTWVKTDFQYTFIYITYYLFIYFFGCFLCLAHTFVRTSKLLNFLLFSKTGKMSIPARQSFFLFLFSIALLFADLKIFKIAGLKILKYPSNKKCTSSCTKDTQQGYTKIH